MKQFNPRGTISCALALAVFAPIASADLVQVTASPSPLWLHEGDTGIVTWTVKNIATQAITIKDITFAGGTGPLPGLIFLDGDRNDEVFNFLFTDRNDRLPDGTIMAVGQTNTFHMQVETRDLDMANSGNNVGKWRITINVNVNDSVPDSAVGIALVNVTDGPAPAPGVAALFMVAGAFGTGRRRP